ncbi:NGG1p interacting factor 3 protein, NIF3 [Desulfovibrio sp. X2]|uniref:Nif3-like dinuclear metal center hexameric protein n=1 Tax=Desulfovibrio sp. X2 TaxID=941449 RepID=UPI000358F094|nr:Nif3-like dinuclear metal center hexameric protein [Desulfovibrio sp. X2]EPR37559.1 NGG1p interacting factor 3 protein, NIF3 [Desulfovibrio sp. X2]
MKAQEIIRRIERSAPLHLQEDWDKSGVQIAGDREDVHRLALSLDPTPAFVTAALAWGADFLLSHHPLTLAPRLPAAHDSYRETLRLVLCSGAWLYAAHTSLDSMTGGPVSWLADELSLRNLAPLVPSAADPAVGLGFVGDLPEPEDAKGFLARLQGLTGRGFATLCGPEAGRDGGSIRRVACCPGSGASLMERAAAVHADVFVTGDVKYHQAQEAPLPVVDVGHFCLEEEMMRRLCAAMADDLGALGVEVRFFPGVEPIRLLSGGPRGVRNGD